jgi:hypothetical protein
MNSTNNHAESPNRTDSCASASEVRDFLKHMKGRDTEEVLGTQDSHSLAGAMVQATIITVVFMVVFTFGPMVWSTPHTDATPAAKPADAKVDTPQPSKVAETPAPAPSTTAAIPPATANPQPPNAKDALDKIGANDTKKASPKVNPLEKSADDLFKDLDKK